MAYHNGSVWPHDNALIAWGLARHGLGELAPADLEWDVRRRAGFRSASHARAVLRIRASPARALCRIPWRARRRLGPRPRYSCCYAPAWASRSARPQGHIHFNSPRLPSSLTELRIHNLEMAGTSVDLLLVRHEEGIGVNVLRRDSDIRITVEQ